MPPRFYISGRYAGQPAIPNVGVILNVPLGSCVPGDRVSEDWLDKYAAMAAERDADGNPVYQVLVLDWEGPVPENGLPIIAWAAAKFRPLRLPMRWYQPFTLPEFGVIGTLRDDNADAYAALVTRVKALARAMPRDVGVAPSLYRMGIDDSVDRLARHVQTWRIVRDCFVDAMILPLGCHRAAVTGADYVNCPPVPPAEFRSMLEFGFGMFDRVGWFRAPPDTDVPWDTAKVSDPYTRVFLEVAGVQA